MKATVEASVGLSEGHRGHKIAPAGSRQGVQGVKVGIERKLSISHPYAEDATMNFHSAWICVVDVPQRTWDQQQTCRHATYDQRVRTMPCTTIDEMEGPLRTPHAASGILPLSDLEEA
ncbi:hypothetical protein M8818_003838 [Zalaria obscura]|uniref:Uncharacterized protein n=1 Tax=Zalaria obscura TaxID=2024903 RepID=A0ACC3SDK2_9PEZI